MERVIKIGDRDVVFHATALTASAYRECFKIDLLDELNTLSETTKTNREGSALWCIGMFERLAYVMAEKESPQPDFETWLEGFRLLELRQAMPEIAKFWTDSMATTVEPKKKMKKTTRKTTTALFYLRCSELGLSMSDLGSMTVGAVNDLLIESSNDSFEYPFEATDEDIDRL